MFVVRSQSENSDPNELHIYKEKDDAVRKMAINIFRQIITDKAILYNELGIISFMNAAEVISYVKMYIAMHDQKNCDTAIIKPDHMIVDEPTYFLTYMREGDTLINIKSNTRYYDNILVTTKENAVKEMAEFILEAGISADCEDAKSVIDVVFSLSDSEIVNYVKKTLTEFEFNDVSKISEKRMKIRFKDGIYIKAEISPISKEK